MPGLEGYGVIYVLTIADTVRVASSPHSVEGSLVVGHERESEGPHVVDLGLATNIDAEDA